MVLLSCYVEGGVQGIGTPCTCTLINGMNNASPSQAFFYLYNTVHRMSQCLVLYTAHAMPIYLHDPLSIPDLQGYTCTFSDHQLVTMYMSNGMEHNAIV